MNQLADQQLAHQINQELTVEQAIRDKTEMVMAAAEDAERADQDEQKNDDEDQKDDDFDDLDAMDENEEKMMRNMAEMRMAAKKIAYEEQQTNKILGHGTYSEIVEEEFLPTVTKTQYVIVHFFHKDFERCKIIDMHLKKIAPEHIETRFVSMDAERAPFFINKLQIQVLPTLVCFEDGIAIDRVIGFEELGETDDFPTMNLIRRLVKVGMLLPKNKTEKGQMKMRRGKKDDSDDDEY